MQRGVAQQVVKQAVLVRLVVDEMHLLFDIFVLGLRRRDADDLRLTRDAFGHAADVAFERRREEHGLAVSRRRGNDGLDIVNEAHV